MSTARQILENLGDTWTDPNDISAKLDFKKCTVYKQLRRLLKRGEVERITNLQDTRRFLYRRAQ